VNTTTKPRCTRPRCAIVGEHSAHGQGPMRCDGRSEFEPQRPSQGVLEGNPPAWTEAVQLYGRQAADRMFPEI
jgi:hypothetical protein